MGKWTEYSGVNVNPNDFQDAVEDILREYGDVIYQATEEGLTAAEKVLIRNLKAATPKKTGSFAKGWKGSGKRYKLRRYIGNTTTVDGLSGEISLANIFEYSTLRGKPFIKRTYEASINEMADAVVSAIKKEA